MLAVHIILTLVSLWLISGTLLNLSKHPHWYIRGWDFPRGFTAALATGTAALHVTLVHARWWDWLLVAGLVFVVARQLYLMFPYTPLARKRVRRSTRAADGTDTLRLVISNLLQENLEHDRWLRTVRAADADVIVVVELSRAWDAAIVAALGDDYPHRARVAQDNYYGMAVLSRLAFDGAPDVRHVVQDDVPSIHLTLRLRDGQPVRLHALHPRPPEPLRNQDSAPRDAELVIVGREIGEHERSIPTVVCGDLNDVAWSYTTQLFLRLSRLLDPRMGRGQFASYNANSRIFRFPLDHVFHSDEFKLIELRVLDNVGSDHFPMFIALSCEPEEARRDQPETDPKAKDHEEAAEIVDEQAAREAKGEEHGHARDHAK